MKYFLIFCCVWWLVFFIVLPMGITTHKNPKQGFADSAPIKPRILMKFIVTTAISLVFILALVCVVQQGYIDNEFLNRKTR